jgi:APA family basic amino acid/polyamine antiporter
MACSAIIETANQPRIDSNITDCSGASQPWGTDDANMVNREKVCSPVMPPFGYEPEIPLRANEPARVLGPIDATCIVIGAIIGVGIFFTPSEVASLCRSESLTLIAWAIGGAIALCGALVFAELGKRYHGSAAHYQILRDSYGPLVGFVFVFCNATAIIAGSMGIIAITCAKNIFEVVGGHKPGWIAVAALSCALIIGLMFANIIGAKLGSYIQNLTVYAKLLTLLAIIGMAMLFAPQAPSLPTGTVVEAATSEINVFVALTGALVFTLFAYGGWQQALWISGEVKDPSRNLARAIVGGVVIVVTVYLLVNWAYLHLLGVEGVAKSETLAADAVGSVAPRLGRRAIAAAVALSAFGVLNAQLLTGPRLIFGLSRDGRFFRTFGLLSATFGTPLPAILLLSLLSIVLVIAAREKGINHLLNGVVFIDGIFFTLTGLALLVLWIRERRGDARITAAKSKSLPLAWIVLPLFIVGEAGVVIGAYVNKDLRNSAYLGAGWIVFAVILYFAGFHKPDAGRRASARVGTR